MALPTGGIVPASVSTDLGPVQNGFDPPPNPTCSLGLARPDRLQNIVHQRHIYGLYRQIADNRHCICFEGRLPLGLGFSVFPAVGPGGHISLGAMPEGDRAGSLSPRLFVLSIAGGNGVHALRPLAYAPQKLSHGLRQGICRDRNLGPSPAPCRPAYTAAPRIGLLAMKHGGRDPHHRCRAPVS